jgi:hypothetical protein
VKAKFKAFGFLTGFMDVPKARCGDRMYFPVFSSRPLQVPRNGKEIFRPDLAEVKQVTFECRGFDDDKALIYELVDF